MQATKFTKESAGRTTALLSLSKNLHKMWNVDFDVL